MKPETLEALKKSIEHWERLSSGDGTERYGPGYCALCMKFNKGFIQSTKGEGFKIQRGNCDGCPVAAKTGKDCCEGTPYTELEKAERNFEETNGLFDDKDWTSSDEFVEIAKRELEFLRSLLADKHEESAGVTLVRRNPRSRLARQYKNTKLINLL